MPEDDVSDLRDVVDAINKLCETMKTSYDEYEDCEDDQDIENDDTELLRSDVVLNESVVDTCVVEKWDDTKSGASSPEPYLDTSFSVIEPVVTAAEVLVIKPVPYKFETCKVDRLSDTGVRPAALAPEQKDAIESVPKNIEIYRDSSSETIISSFEPIFEKVKINKSERWSDPVEFPKQVAAKADLEFLRNVGADRFDEMETNASDVETVPCEPISEMYYTASSEVSLLSDVDFQDKAQTEDSDREKDDRNIMAGHVAAMRERFESMTRTNTPCPDLIRSISPSIEVFRNCSTTPDKLE